METQSEFCAWTEAEWKELWSRRAPGVRLAPELLSAEESVRGLIRDACSFFGGVAYPHRFRLFHNGGLPLLERRRGAWTEEMVFRSPSTGRDGIWAPITVQIHLSCEEFADVRRRYWAVTSKPPRVVTGGNVGQLCNPGRWLLWNLAAGSPVDPVRERIAGRLLDQAIPWFDAFGNPARMRRRLYEDGVPLLDSTTALEWCLFEFGAGEANDYLNTVVLRDEMLRESVVRLVGRIDPAYLEGGSHLPVARNLAALMATYDLRCTVT